ncbi:MAG TPA: cyclase family protein [Bacillota bacterium]
MVRIIDLTEPWGPSWQPVIGHPKPLIKSFQTHISHRLETYVIETTMHVGTHIDAPFHGAPNGCDVASLGWDVLYGTGLIIDLSRDVGPWTVITPDLVRSALRRMGDEIRRGDRVFFYTGWRRYSRNGSAPDEETFLGRHPGASHELIDWLAELRVAMVGQDAPSFDHPAAYLRQARPDLVAEFEQTTGLKADELFPPHQPFYGHRRLGELNIPHVDGLGGEIATVAGRRLTIGVFPWRFVGGEASICRVVAFVED